MLFIQLLSTGTCQAGDITIQAGERVQVDDCKICFCRGTETLCDIRSCPPPSCENPVKIDGECCEVCETCQAGNITIQAGERVQVDDCRICFCRGNETRCDIRSCPPPDCENPVKIDGECCEVCETCQAGNITIQAGERVQVDDCRICFCRGNETRCDIRSCPPPDCENPVKIDGECCEVCGTFSLLLNIKCQVYLGIKYQTGNGHKLENTPQLCFGYSPPTSAII